jgi:hypothetical protein
MGYIRVTTIVCGPERLALLNGALAMWAEGGVPWV